MAAFKTQKSKKVNKKKKPKKVVPQVKKKRGGQKGNHGGAPRKEIDFQVVQGMCQVWATAEEIAGFLEISVDTLSARIKEKFGISFSEYYKKHSAAGKISLRRVQYRKAIGGNVSMMIWLGKQVLGQRDHVEPDDENGNIQPVQVLIEVEDAS